VQVGVVQFSNDVRVELAPQALRADGAALRAALRTMTRLNGGTNMSNALLDVGKLFKSCLPPGAARTVALLTDGRVDTYQARQTRDAAARLADEQAGVRLFAFGVGRGVDKGEMLALAGADRYLGLMTRDDPPW